MERVPAKRFEDLFVWKKAHEMVLLIYKISEKFPRKEMYGLTSQFRRAAISVAANIAEGFKKKSKLDKIRFLNIAQGSLEECRYYLILANDLQYMANRDMFFQIEEVSKLLATSSRSIISSNH